LSLYTTGQQCLAGSPGRLERGGALEGARKVSRGRWEEVSAEPPAQPAAMGMCQSNLIDGTAAESDSRRKSPISVRGVPRESVSEPLTLSPKNEEQKRSIKEVIDRRTAGVLASPPTQRFANTTMRANTQQRKPLLVLNTEQQ
jgi:hypothetical protein